MCRRQTHLARNLLPTLLLLLPCPSVLFARSFDGFVTNVESPARFEIGKLTVDLSDQTECGLEQTFGLKFRPIDALYMIRPHNVWRWTKTIKNPQQKGTPYVSPGYAAYGFAFMSEFYPGVDYSKLNRGDAEYAQFLKQLRRSDPSAFNPSQ